METLEYEIASRAASQRLDPVLIGVTASGNCEVLIEPGVHDDRYSARVHTSARGFGAIWQAVLEDFGALHAAGGLKIEINDVGATPAVVGLRLVQALEAWEAGDA